MGNSEQFLTAAEVAEKLRMKGPWQVVKWCRNGELRAIKPGKTWLITAVDLDAFLESRSNQRAAS